MFGDPTLSGFGKFGWSLLLIFLPFLGAFIYLIARGKSMNERQRAKMADAQASQERYIQRVAAKTATPAEQIATLRASRACSRAPGRPGRASPSATFR